MVNLEGCEWNCPTLWSHLEHVFGKTERTMNLLSIAYLQVGFEPGTYWLQITNHKTGIYHYAPPFS